MLHHFTNKQFSVGIDINEREIAFVELQQNGNTIHLIHAECCSLAHLNIAHKKIYAAIPSEQIIRKTLSFGRELNKKNIRLLLATNPHEYFPGIQEKLVFDFTQSNHNQNTCVFAVREEDLIQQMHRLANKRIQPSCIEPDSHAFIRIIRHTKTIQLTSNKIALLLIPSQNGRMILFNESEILYEHNIMAEEINLCQTLKNFLFNLPDHHLEKIYILGAYDHQWTEQLQHTFNTPPTPLDPFQYLFNEKPHNTEQLYLALGLALRGIHHDRY